MTPSDLENFFIYHPPIGNQLPRYQSIRDAGHKLAMEIYQHTPSGADQTAAIRKVREAVMTANAAIACGERQNELPR